jgi:UPF0755 protein
MGAVARIGSGLLTLGVTGMVVVGAGALVLSHYYDRSGPLEVTRSIVIDRGEGRIEIAERLERDGIISSRWAFVANHLVRNLFGSGKPLELKAGEYEFKKGATMREVLETIAEGKSVLYKVTLPEGLTSQQIVERVNADPNLSGEITQIPAEGTLLPDTYRVSKGMARQELLERMRADQQRLIEAIWDKRQPDLPIRTPQEAIILASIVEKETGRADERERVAAVFINRLRKNMRLQSDPTIIYGIVAGQGSLGRPITRSDIETKTAYNTYRINGLPPGPICNPGRASIEAVLQPAKTDDLYFVADGTGGHKFSATLAEHNAAVRVWRQIEKTQNARSAAGGAAAATDELPVMGSDDAGGAPQAAMETAAEVGIKPNQAAAANPNEAAVVSPVPPQSASAATIPLPLRKPRAP